ncbi:MAG TPA: hypothetical protein VKA40_06795 [Nitrososphaera sp.]|nr:hypothetical protein [Nitrososphaera sp.]
MKKNNYGGLKTSAMPSKLSTLVSRIPAIPNYDNAKIIDEFYQYMKENGASEKHMTNELQTILYYTTFLGPQNCLLDINKREQILAFLNTKQKDENRDPSKNLGHHRVWQQQQTPPPPLLVQMLLPLPRISF